MVEKTGDLSREGGIAGTMPTCLTLIRIFYAPCAALGFVNDTGGWQPERLWLSVYLPFIAKAPHTARCLMHQSMVQCRMWLEVAIVTQP